MLRMMMVVNNQIAISLMGKNRLVTNCNRMERGEMNTIDMIRHDLEDAYKELKNWRKVGDEFGISEGMAWRIVNEGYEPKEVEIRMVLGLPALAMAPVCPYCGVVHVSKRCPSKMRRRRYRKLSDMSDEEILWSFENRVEMEER